MPAMKFLKTAITCTLICASTLAIAQQHMKTPKERAEHQTQWMQKNLALTQEQNNKVYDILLYYARENEEVKGMPRGRKKRMEKEGMRHDKDGELKGVLTPDQYQKYQQHVQEIKEKRREKRAGQMGY